MSRTSSSGSIAMNNSISPPTERCIQTLEMQLASGNIPGQVGSYDQCLNMKSYSAPSSSSSSAVGTLGAMPKYCLLLAPNTRLVHRVVGLCVPSDGCSDADIVPSIVFPDPHLNATFGGNTTLHQDGVTPAEVFCSDYETHLSVFGIFVVVFAVLMGIFVLVCTMYRYVKSTETLGRMFCDKSSNPSSSQGQPPRAEGSTPERERKQQYGGVVDHLNNSSGSANSSLHGTSLLGSITYPQGTSGSADFAGGVNGETSESPDRETSALGKIAEGFSLIDSFPRWRAYVRDEPSNLFHSVRVLAWLWVTVVDVFTYTQHIPTYNNEIHERSNVMYSILQRRSAANFGIGTFILLSGFSTAQLLYADSTTQSLATSVREERDSTAKLLWRRTKWYVSLIVRRWLRLVPLYGLVMLLVHSTLSTMGSGPFWATFVESAAMGRNCAGTGWMANIFFINNLYPTDASDRCFPWSFYFALEFQFFLFGPLVIWLYRNCSLRTGAILAGIVMLISCVFRGVNAYTSLPSSNSANTTDAAFWGVANDDLQSSSDHTPGSFSFPDATEPPAMVIPWLTGIMLYIFYTELRSAQAESSIFASDLLNLRAQKGASMEKFSLSVLNKMKKKATRILFIWGGVGLGVLVVVIEWVIETSNAVEKSRTNVGVKIGITVFQSVDLFLWCLGALGLFLPMLLMYGGFLRRFLCHPLWSGLSRLVFAAYLVHPIVILFYNAERAAPAQMAFLPFVYDSCGHVVLTLLLAFVLHLCIEQPSIFLTSPDSQPARGVRYGPK